MPTSPDRPRRMNPVERLFLATVMSLAPMLSPSVGRAQDIQPAAASGPPPVDGAADLVTNNPEKKPVHDSDKVGKKGEARIYPLTGGGEFTKVYLGIRVPPEPLESLPLGRAPSGELFDVVADVKNLEGEKVKIALSKYKDEAWTTPVHTGPPEGITVSFAGEGTVAGKTGRSLPEPKEGGALMGRAVYSVVRSDGKEEIAAVYFFGLPQENILAVSE